MAIELPVKITDKPFWRVNIRPQQYEAELIPSLAGCYKAIEQTKVRLRGWDYPHLSHRDAERGQGPNWIASWAQFMDHAEYWRLFQSGQFIHLFVIREASSTEWRKKLEETTKSHLFHMKDIDWPSVPGFISILNFLYTVTEVFEFATRLCQRGVLRGDVEVSIRLSGIKGFVLTTDWNRSWMNYYAASENILAKTWTVPSDSLVAEGPTHSMGAILWFFERFGWLDPATAVLKEDQEKFLRGKI